MVRSKAKTIFVVGLIVLAIAILLVIRGVLNDSLGPGRLRLPVGKGIPAISLSERHGLILASDGSLWSWGSDFLGWPVLGLGSNAMKSVNLKQIGTDTNWVSISAGDNHNVAVKSDGTLWTWGTRLPSYKTIYTPILAAPGNDWKQAAAGGTVCVALKKDGTLWAWGHNWTGQLGIGSTNNSSVPLKVGSGTNWVKVWAGILETVAMQSDGSLWYWGENPNPAFAQGVNPIVSPKRISDDTNWADVGFGVNTVFTIKADGTLWTWGRQADRYTGAKDPAQNAVPTRVGTNSDWQSICATTGWWINGLIKRDGSLWLMDGSEGKENGPRTPYQQVQFRRIPFQKDYAVYAGGATHAAAPGVHGPIGVILTKDGEVWTWGMVLGDPLTLKGRLQALGVRIARKIHPGNKVSEPEAAPVYRNEMWRLRNMEAK
jgi:alpha-tubulin suppressor-like RCC1 family protein